MKKTSRSVEIIIRVTSLGLLLGGGFWACSKTEPYTPPDPFYYFASYKVGKNPTTVTTGDLNQDSFTDLVTTNIASNTISILLGNGDGTFKDQIQLHVCQEPRALAMSDFNEDGHDDVALACSGGDEIALLLRRTTLTVMGMPILWWRCETTRSKFFSDTEPVNFVMVRSMSMETHRHQWPWLISTPMGNRTWL